MNKKIFFISSIIFLLGFFVLPKLSSAEVIMGIDSLSQDTVTLSTGDLSPNENVIFTVKNEYSSTDPYSQTVPETSDDTGFVSATFSNLSPGGQYVATINDVGSITILATTSFYTFAGITLSITPPTSTSVTLQAQNLTPNKQIVFTVMNMYSTAPAYNKHNTATANSDGSASSDFSVMNPDSRYIGTLNYVGDSGILAAATFWTAAGSGGGNTPTCSDGKQNGDETGIDCGGSCPNACTGGGGGGGNNGPSGLVPCGTAVDASGKITNPCEANGIKYLMDMINTVINFILVYLAVPIAAIMFAYAGFLLVFSGGESSKRTKAKDIFINVALGLVFVAAAWLIVHTVLSIVGYDQTWNTWFGL